MAELESKVAELFQYMDSTRAALLDDARTMNASFASIRPRAGEWSAVETLAHLALVESNITQLVTKTIARAREQGIGPDTSHASFMSSLDEWRVAEPLTKLAAPSRISPDEPGSVRASIESLERSRAELKSIILRNTDIDLHAVKRPHPILGELDMYQWALFVAQHEERHRKQMERALAQVTERAAECAPIV